MLSTDKGKVMPQKIKAWSFSRWDVYQSCPAKAYYKFIERLPDPSGPAAERGNMVHRAAEDFVEGKIKAVPTELRAHSLEMREIKKVKAVCEQEWALTEGFEAQTGWFDRDAWCRAKVDVLDTSKKIYKVPRIIDHKTGKVYPEKHALQGELYALFGLKILEVSAVTVEFWYHDLGPRVKSVEYYGLGERSLPKMMKRWGARTKAMLSDTKFKATPSTLSCRWCPFANSKGGPCKKEVQ